MRFKFIDPSQERRAIQKWIQQRRRRLFSLMALGKHDEFNKTTRMIEQAEAKLSQARRLG